MHWELYRKIICELNADKSEKSGVIIPVENDFRAKKIALSNVNVNNKINSKCNTSILKNNKKKFQFSRIKLIWANEYKKIRRVTEPQILLAQHPSSFRTQKTCSNIITLNQIYNYEVSRS